MKIKFWHILLGFILISVLTIFSNKVFLASDILNYLPLYSIEKWEKPHNSLLADPVFQFEPWRMYAKQNIINGNFPFWNDKNGNGAPFFANPQTAVLYPLNFIYYLLPVEISLNLIFLLKLYLYGIFFYLYVRQLKISQTASFLGTLVAVFSAFPIVWVQWPHTNVFILFPLILYFTEKIRNEKKFIHRYITAIPILYFIGVLGGHPETLFLIAVVNILYVLLTFTNRIKNSVMFVICIFIGLLLGSIQIIPFFEYLLNSYALHYRTTSNSSFLPVISFVQNLIPFIMGAPHTEFYKPILENTNFQETIGGYVGSSVLIFVVFGLLWTKLYKKIPNWVLIGFISLIFAYGLIPHKLLNFIPFINVNANERFVAFFGFAITVIFSLLIEKLITAKFKPLNINFKRLYLIPVSVIFVYLTTHFGTKKILEEYPEKTRLFLYYFENHLFLILFLNIIFFTLIYFSIKSRGKKIFIYLLILPILSQNIYFFWNYNNRTPTEQYYPKTELIKILQSLPEGNILEIGNLAITPNLNLAYKLPSIENNDAIQVYNYRRSFDQSFPIKNQWNNVDQVNYRDLKKFGVRYLISDYNVNDAKQVVQAKYEKILPAIIDKPVFIPFKANYDELDAVRLLTANFNRINTCVLKLSILEENNRQISSSEYSCKDIRDYSYNTFEFSGVKLVPGKNYYLKIESPNTKPDNFIALWGSRNGKPFTQLFYKNKTEDIYKLLYKEKSVYLWEIPSVNKVITNGTYSRLTWESGNITLLMDNKKNENLEIVNTFYPGWSVYIDGKKEKLINTNPFMAVLVPAGKHLVVFKYIPYSFYFGTIIALIIALIIFIYFIRNELKQKNYMNISKKWKMTIIKINIGISWYKHVFIFISGFIISSYIYVIAVKKLNLHFVLKKTDIINWHSVHNYPKQQEYFYFFTAFLFILIFTILIWLIWIWIKQRKS